MNRGKTSLLRDSENGDKSERKREREREMGDTRERKREREKREIQGRERVRKGRFKGEREETKRIETLATLTTIGLFE